MKFNCETEKDAKMSSKKKKTNPKSKSGDTARFNEGRSVRQGPGKCDPEPQGFPPSNMHDVNPFADSGRFPDGGWPKDGYNKPATLPPPHFNNFNPGFSNMISYPRNNEDGETVRIMRNEHYSPYDMSAKSGFMGGSGVGRHSTESQMSMLPHRANFTGGSRAMHPHGFSTNSPSNFMQHNPVPGMQQTYPTPTPMLTQLLRYPTPGEKFPGQMDDYRTAGPTKNWMENASPGMNQNMYQRPTMPFYEQRPIPQMNPSHTNQISGPHHGSHIQPSPAAGNVNSSNPFAPPSYVQSGNPMQRVDVNDKCSRSSSQPRPLSVASSGAPLGSPNDVRSSSPVPSLPRPRSRQSEKGGSSLQKSASSTTSKSKKMKEEVNNIQDISSCDEFGSDSSSSTEVYSQITPMSTPSTTPLPPQSTGTKASPQGSAEDSPSNTPTPSVVTSASLAAVPGTPSLPGTSVPSGSASSLSGVPSSSLMPIASQAASEMLQMGTSPSSNYPRSPGGQSAYCAPNQYPNHGQMYYAGSGGAGVHHNQPCGNYPPYQDPNSKAAGQGQYIHGHSQGMHHPMEMENAGGTGKGYHQGMPPSGMYAGPGKLSVGPSSGGPMGNAMQGLHYQTPPGTIGPTNQGPFNKSSYGAPQFGAVPGNGASPLPNHQQHMGPYPGPAYMNHMPFGPRQMMSPLPPHVGSGGGAGSMSSEHGMRPSSPAFYRGTPVGYESPPDGHQMAPSSAMNNTGRSHWVMNTQGMSGGSLVEAVRSDNNNASSAEVLSIPPSVGDATPRPTRTAAFDAAMKDSLTAPPPLPPPPPPSIVSVPSLSSSVESLKPSDSSSVHSSVKMSEHQLRIENDFSNSSTIDSQCRGMMSPNMILSKSIDVDSSRKDFGQDSNSLPGQERSRTDSEKQETLSSPPATPFNHINSSPASLDRDIGSPNIHSSISSSSINVFNKIIDMGNEQDRRIFLERLFSFMSYRSSPITAVPIICKQSVDLYRLYHLVRERGGMVDVTKNKKWREVSTSLNLGASSSAGFTLKRNYAKFLFPFECRFDRGNIDPAPIVASMEMSTKKESKKNNADRAAELDNCRPPSNQSFGGYPPPPLPSHAMHMSDMLGHGNPNSTMTGPVPGPSQSPYNGGIGGGGMMQMPNHSRMIRSSETGQNTVTIQDPFLDIPGVGQPGSSTGTQYQPLNVNNMYGPPNNDLQSNVMHGSYDHRPNMATGVAPPSVFTGQSNQCMPPSMAASANQGNGFGEMCNRGGRMVNEAAFGNRGIQSNEYASGGGGAGYGPPTHAVPGLNMNCQPSGERFDGMQPNYTGVVPRAAKHHGPPDTLGTNDPSYYGPYGNQVTGQPPQRYPLGYDPHFYGGSPAPVGPGYPGSQKMTNQVQDGYPQSHSMDGGLPPHQPGAFPVQKGQSTVAMVNIQKGDLLDQHDYQIASQGGRSHHPQWMQHQYAPHYPPQPPYPTPYGMHLGGGGGRGPYGPFLRYPFHSHRFDVEKMQRGPGPLGHHLSPNRDIVFPAGSVEATRPRLAKKRKLTAKDLGSIDAWHLMMALRSGLITESTWALDVLTVLLRDDTTSPCLSLSHMPGLLEVLVEHFRRCLILIFGVDFEELEISSEMQSRYTVIVNGDDKLMEEDLKVLPDAKSLEAANNFTLKTRDGKNVGIRNDDNEDDEEMLLLDGKDWDTFKEFESSSFDWQMGRGDTTVHIITTFTSEESRHFHRKKYFGRRCDRPKDKMAADVVVDEDGSSSSSVRKEEKMEMDDNNKKTENSVKCTRVCEIESSKDEKKTSSDSKLSKTYDDGRQKETDEPNKDDIKTDGRDSASAKRQISVTRPSHSTDSDVAVEFDNFDNNLFTCTQLDSLKRSCSELDEETYRPNDGISCHLTDSQIEISQRCLSLLNIFRNLSFIAGNDIEICKHNGLMLVLGKLLLLNHQHLPRTTKQTSTNDVTSASFDNDAYQSSWETKVKVNEESADDDDKSVWWWDMLEGLRENTLVVFANICGALDLSMFPEEICLPILNGLLHWLVCSSAEALDPLTPSGLSPQRLVLEALCKLCVTDSNIDLVLATPPFSRIVLLITNLANMLSERHQQVIREFAVGLLSCLVPGDTSVARALALQHPSITLLLEFIEGAEQQAIQSMHGGAVSIAAAFRDNPNIMGTSSDMLCRAATILRHLVDVPENASLISRHQQKLMQLVMSQILDQSVTAILADVLSACS